MSPARLAVAASTMPVSAVCRLDLH